MRRAALTTIVAVALVAAGYVYLPATEWNDSESEARQRVTEYLSAVVGGTTDRGWKLLHPNGRRTYGSEDVYREAMEAADWTNFAWEFGESAPCDDGVCTIVLRLRHGRGSVPEVAWSTGPGDPGVFLSTKESTDGAREAGELLRRQHPRERAVG